MKSNIDILKDYVAGVRPVIQVGYTKKDAQRKVGEEWVDSKGITWRQENGFKTRVNKQADVIRKAREQKCKTCNRVIAWGTKLDQYFFLRTGLCETCLIDYETKLRIVGVYPDYEKYKLLSYELGSLKDIKEKLKEIVKFFTESTGDVEMICNSEGFIEKWKNTNKDQILKDAKNDLKLARRRITAVTKERDAAKARYVEGAAKYQLESYV